MKAKLQIIIITLILVSGFIFYHSKKETYEMAKEFESFDGQSQNGSKFATLSYFFPFLKSDFQKKMDQGESVNFLVLGYGGEDHSGGYLTDTIILGRMNFKTGEVSLMNIPRDLWVNGEKINVIYAVSQQAGEVIRVLEDLMEIEIDYYLTIDFDGFRQAVDELNGLEIYVEKTFDDYQYPRHDNDQIDPGVMHIHFEEGWETMSGERALEFARSRYSLEDGGDYNRSQRQQKVIQAFKEKLLETKNVKALFNVAKIIAGHFQTNFPYVEAIRLYKYVTDRSIKINHKILSEDNYLYSTYNDEGSFILLPKNNDWVEIRKYFLE